MAVKKARIPKITRDLVLFALGILGIIHETLLQTSSEHPYLLMVFAGMVGLPVFLHQDESRFDEKDPKKPTLEDLSEWMESQKGKK